jgi:MFS family permease
MRTAYRSVLCRRDVLSALVPYVAARLPLTMAPLALLLLAQEQTGSYHRAGLVCGAYAVAVAIAAPMLGRLVDRRGQGQVLLGAGLVHPAAMVGAAFAAESGHYLWLVLAAVVAGASLPPVTACMRVLWSRLLPDETARKAGFAIEGVIVEVAELSGPLLVSLLLALGRPALAVGSAGVVMGLAALGFRISPASRSVPAVGVSRTGWGALANRGVRRLLLIVAASTGTIGAVEVAVTAFARDHGGLASAGLYIGVISVGGIVAGVVFGGSERVGRRGGVGMLAGLLLLSGVAAASLAGSTSPVFELVSLFVFGGAVSVGVIMQLATMSAVVSEEHRTEAFTWGATANFVGLGLGTAVAGWAVDHYGLSTAFTLSALPMVLAALLTLLSRNSFIAVAETGAVDVPVEVPVETVPSAVAAAPVVASAPHPDVVALADEVAALRAHVTDLESALTAALDSPGVVVGDARDRARRMLDRADAACLELRDRASDDAERVRSAATTASLEIMAAAERDARAMLDRARREADGIVARARRTAATSVAPRRPMLHALPDIGADDDGQEAVGGS